MEIEDKSIIDVELEQLETQEVQELKELEEVEKTELDENDKKIINTIHKLIFNKLLECQVDEKQFENLDNYLTQILEKYNISFGFLSKWDPEIMYLQAVGFILIQKYTIKNNENQEKTINQEVNCENDKSETESFSFAS